MAVKEGKGAIETLEELGYRLTPQRMMVLSAIEASQDHISAEEIYARVRAQYPRVNISTVYRTLELLKRLGLVTETNLGEGHVCYHYVDRSQHHHLICQKCGEKFELGESFLRPLKEALARDYGFRPDLRHLAIFGHCAKCRS